MRQGNVTSGFVTTGDDISSTGNSNRTLVIAVVVVIVDLIIVALIIVLAVFAIKKIRAQSARRREAARASRTRGSSPNLRSSSNVRNSSANVRSSQSRSNISRSSHAIDMEVVTPKKTEYPNESKYGSVMDYAVYSSNSDNKSIIPVILDKYCDVEKRGLFAIVEGNGKNSKEAANFISEAFPQNLMIELTKPRTDLDNWFSFCEDATTQSYFITDRMILESSDTLYEDSGSAIVSVLVMDNETDYRSINLEEKFLLVSNIGTAQAVLKHGNESLRITTKHVPIDHKESYRLNQLSCPIYEGKVKGVLETTRAFGHSSLKKYVISDPHIEKYDVRIQDTHLIIASSELWKACSEEEIIDLVRIDGLGKTPKEIIEILAKQARKKKAGDYCMIVLQLRAG